MADDKLDKELEATIENAMSDVGNGTTGKPAPMPQAGIGASGMPKTAQFKAIPRQELSLSQQWTKLELIETELKDRIRREQLKMQAEYDRRSVDIKNDYATRISEEIARLEKQRDKELRELAEEFIGKLREHEVLTKRMIASY